MLAKLRSTDSSSVPEWTATDFQAARERYRSMVAERAALLGERDDLRALSVWLNATDSERASDRYAWARTRIEARWPDGRLPKERALPDLFQALEDKIEDAASEWQKAEIEFQTAKVRESNRIAKSLQFRQRKAVAGIAAALSALSAAVGGAVELEEEFRAQSPMRESPYFIDCTRELASFAPLGSYDSTASQWVRRMKNIGVIS